jgi:hypothetical protein
MKHPMMLLVKLPSLMPMSSLHPLQQSQLPQSIHEANQRLIELYQHIPSLLMIDAMQQMIPIE